MITVVDLGTGNIGSVLKALRSIGANFELTHDSEKIAQAKKILLPGVCAFGTGMEGVHRHGLRNPLREAALERKIPFLGICMGMQIMASKGFELGNFEGLGIIQGAEVKQLDPDLCPTIPHMGWNNLEETEGNPMLAGLPDKPDFYFVHSFHMEKIPPGVKVSVCDNGQKITAAIAQGNVFGAQFHPEKSQANGLKLLRNFAEYA